MGRPLGRGIRRHIDMEDLTAILSEPDEDPQDPERERRDDEEVDRDELADVILQEGSPGLRRRGTTTHQVVPDRGFGVEAYSAWTAAQNRTSYKDPAVLSRFLRVAGDKPLDRIAPFDVERWKTARVKEVSRATVNRELNIVRGVLQQVCRVGAVSQLPGGERETLSRG